MEVIQTEEFFRYDLVYNIYIHKLSDIEIYNYYVYDDPSSNYHNYRELN